MSRLINEHLENVTEENLLKHQEYSFNRYAKARGVEIGTNGKGGFVVVKDDHQYIYLDPQSAIKKYTEFVKE